MAMAPDETTRISWPSRRSSAMSLTRLQPVAFQLGLAVDKQGRADLDDDAP
jgi:hypothetical protein